MNKGKKIAYTALIAALCCVSTYLIVVPLPYGYFNAGDIFVLLAGWLLGGVWGGVGAAVGCALADVWSGYALYAPVTFFIKALVALCAYYLYLLLKKAVKKPALDFLPRLLSALVAETLMVVGYFLFECILYGLGGGVLSLMGNIIQGSVCAVGGMALAALFARLPFMRETFPALMCKVR